MLLISSEKISRMLKLAHLSDLHLGRSHADTVRAERLIAQAVSTGIDHLVVTGDLTHSGRDSELELFRALFWRQLREKRVTIVPGNHDRGGDDAAGRMMNGERVLVERTDGLYLVRIDSTAPHNVVSFRSHGHLCREVIRRTEEALSGAHENELVAVLLHHHVVPLPVETIGEWFAHQFGWPHANELELSNELLQLLRGRCDVVLHGHRHHPRRFTIDAHTERPLRILNAGSSTELQAFRVFHHRDGVLQSIEWTERSTIPSRRLEPVLAGA